MYRRLEMKYKVVITKGVNYFIGILLIEEISFVVMRNKVFEE